MELSGGGASKAPQLQPAQASVLDILNLYLGRIPKSKGDDSYRETPNKMQRVTAISCELPLSSEQFLLDFEQLQTQFPVTATKRKNLPKDMRVILEGNMVALLHAFFSNLPQEWLEGTQIVIKQLRPVNSVALLWITFRLMGPLLPRLASTHSLILKVGLLVKS